MCEGCTQPARRALLAVAKVAGEATTTIARLDVLGDTAGGSVEPEIEVGPKAAYALTSTALPVDFDARDRHRQAVGDLMLWARTVRWWTGDPLPVARLNRVACGHVTCKAARAVNHRLPGPACPSPAPVEHPLALIARWLVDQLGEVRMRNEAPRALSGIEAACRATLAVVDRQPARWSLGRCGAALDPIVLICAEDLRPVAGATTVWCECGAEWDVEERKALLLDRLDDTWLAATKAAHMLRWLGEVANASTIRGWARKGWLMAHPNSLPGQPAYRLGSIRELMRIERERKAAYAVRETQLAEVRRQREQPSREMMSA